MDPPVYDTLILSDVHLGSECSRARDATQVLKDHRFRRLILLGDIFADLNFGRLTKEHWKFLGYIRKLSNPKRNVEVIWVEGNHDQGLTDIMSHLVGVRVYQEYVWHYAGMRHLAIHGHQFDRLVANNLRLNYLGTLLYLRLEKADRIFCGHTHVAMQKERDGLHYYNAGGWIDSKPTYITIDEEGVQIHEYQERPDHRDSSEERGETDSTLAEFAGESGLPGDAEYENIGS